MRSQVFAKTTFIYGLFVFVAMVSMTVTNISFDAEYQLAMAYRMIKGDAMILHMWEPHQTSAIFSAFLMKIFMMITGGTTGIVLYMQVVGAIVRVILACMMYRLIDDVSGRVPAFVAAIIYILTSPKELMLPEFGNMQLWCGTLLFFSLMRYWKTFKVGYLIWAAIWMCAGVLSYPSFLITYFAVVVLLWKYSENHWKSIGIFTLVCVWIGGLFLGYLFLNVSLEVMLECLTAALALEPSHTVTMGAKFMEHLLNATWILAMIMGTAAIGFVISIVWKKMCRIPWKVADGIIVSWYVLQVFLLINILSVKNRGGYAIPFLVIQLLGIWNRKRLVGEEKRMFCSAWAIGVASLLATLILSDNAFLQAGMYMLVSICVSVVPVYYWICEIKGDVRRFRLAIVGVHLFFCVIVFRCLYIHIPIYERDQIYTITEDVALIRSGPAAGIIAEEGGVARQRDSYAEWGNYIQEGDTIWIMGHPVDTLGYLYADVEVGTPTVMSTPTYTEELLGYFEISPEKYPDVIVMESGFGELSWELLRNQWLMEWIDEEYCADEVIDGNYWRYYIRRRD